MFRKKCQCETKRSFYFGLTTFEAQRNDKKSAVIARTKGIGSDTVFFFVLFCLFTLVTLLSDVLKTYAWPTTHAKQGSILDRTVNITIVKSRRP